MQIIPIRYQQFLQLYIPLCALCWLMGVAFAPSTLVPPMPLRYLIELIQYRLIGTIERGALCILSLCTFLSHLLLMSSRELHSKLVCWEWCQPFILFVISYWIIGKKWLVLYQSLKGLDPSLYTSPFFLFNIWESALKGVYLAIFLELFLTYITEYLCWIQMKDTEGN